MGRIYEAFKRAEQGRSGAQNANLNAQTSAKPRPSVPTSEEDGGAPRRANGNVQANGNGNYAQGGGAQQQHRANAEMLERLTGGDGRDQESRAPKTQAETLLRIAERRTENARAPQSPTAAQKNGSAPVVAPSREASKASASSTSAPHVAASDQNAGFEIERNGASAAPQMGGAPAGNSVLSADDAEERKRRIKEMLEASRRKSAANGSDSTADSAQSRIVVQATSIEPSAVEEKSKVADEPLAELIESSTYFSAPIDRPIKGLSAEWSSDDDDQSASDSASVERTAQSRNFGSALSETSGARAAGATADVDGAARAARPENYASVEVNPARVEPHLIAITDPQSPYTERFRSLRTRVLHASERKRMKSFVVTSANPAEGKTLTSINLAWLLAQTEGACCLLIDGDLRQPCVADYLDIEPPAGLSEVLAGERKLSDAIVRLEPSGLYFLPGGANRVARNRVAELFSGPTFNSVLKEARQMFDYVIVDAPPLGVFTDAALLINRADGALLVVRAGKTRYTSLDRLLEPLPRERILGVVLNGSDEQMAESNYYYAQRREHAPARAAR